MNFKTTGILAALVIVGLAAWLLVGERPASESEADKSSALQVRYALDPRPEADEVVRVQIERPDKPRLVFERSGTKDASGAMEDWQMREPVASATESWTVNGIVSTVLGLQYERKFKPGEGGVSLADAGLEQPLGKITLTDKNGKEHRVELGKKVALSNSSYVRVGGANEILVTSRDLSADLKKKPDEYRSKNLYRKLARKDAKHIRVTHEGKTYDLTRSEDTWVVNEPVKAYANADKLTTLVNNFANLRVADFVEDAPASLASFGLDPPYLSLAVTTEEKKQKPATSSAPAESQPAEPQTETVTTTYTLLVGGFADLESKRRFVKLPDQPWIATVEKTAVDNLLPKLSEWRDARVTRVKADDATQLELTAAGVTAALTKEDGVWKGSGDLAELDVEAVKNVLEAFEDVSAIDYVDDAPDLSKYGLDSPRATVKVTTRGAVEPVALKIGADTASGRNSYVLVEGRPTVFVISEKNTERLAIHPMSLRSRVITDYDPAQLRSIEVLRKHGRYALERRDGDWRLVDPPDAPVDAAGIRVLSNDLARLRAKTTHRPAESGSHSDADDKYGLADPELTIRFAVEQSPTTGATPVPPQPATTQPALATQPAVAEGEPSKTVDGMPAGETAAAAPSAASAQPPRLEHTLRVGRVGALTYCRRDDQPYIFELDESIWRAFTDELIDRKLLDLQAEEIAGLRIEAPGGTIEFVREGSEWKYAIDPFVKLVQKKVGDFINELAGLRIERYVSYRDADTSAEWIRNAPVTVTLRLADSSAVTIKVDQMQRGELPRMAAWLEQRRSFLLRPGDVEKLMRGLDYYTTPEAPEPAKSGDDFEPEEDE